MKKDLHFLDKIDAENLETLTPICRDKIRKKNQNYDTFFEKYSNENFNIFNFAFKSVKYFIPGCSWLWIGNNDMVFSIIFKQTFII